MDFIGLSTRSSPNQVKTISDTKTSTSNKSMYQFVWCCIVFKSTKLLGDPKNVLSKSTSHRSI